MYHTFALGDTFLQKSGRVLMRKAREINAQPHKEHSQNNHGGNFKIVAQKAEAIMSPGDHFANCKVTGVGHIPIYASG